MGGKASDIGEIAEWLASSGEIGEPPFYYFVSKAAGKLNCSVFELLDRPDASLWITRGLTCFYGDNAGEAAAMKAAEQRERTKNNKL